MAGQSITFDFLTTGADRTASGFRKVGDNTVLAARGAKVLASAIETLGKKEDRTAAESVILAKALRLTGDAEDRVAAKAVVADAAIRRLDDSMQDSTKSSGKLSKALGGLKLNPGLLGPALLLAPALGSLAGVAAGAAAGLGGAFIAGAGALAAFGAVAKPVLADAKKAATAAETAQTAHAAAVAKVTGQYQYAMSVAKTQAQRNAAYAAEQKGFSAAGLAQTAALSKAYAGLSPQQIALSKQIGAMGDAWDKVKAAQTPVVAGALQPWLKSVTDLTKNLPSIISRISPVIQGLGTQFDNLVNSSAFRGFRDFIGSTGSAAVSAGGSTIIDLVKSFMILLPQFDPLIREAVGWISRLGPAVLTWSSSKKAADQIQSFMQWFSQNGPVVGGLLKNIGGALKALAPGLTSGGALELKAVSDFLGVVAKLPPAVAKPLAEVAGAALILKKTGTLKIGVKFIGATAKWLTGGLINIGGGASAAAEMRAAMVSGGAAAAAQIRAAFTGGGAAAGAETAAGGAGAGTAAGKAAGGGFLAGLSAAVGPAIGGVLTGLLIRGIGDTLSPAGTFAGNLNKQFQADGHMWSVTLLHSFTFGGLEGWLTSKIGEPVGGALNNVGSGAKLWAKGFAQSIGGFFSSIGHGAAVAFGHAGDSADTLRTKNLAPLLGEVGKVSGGIQGLAGTIQGTMLTALRAAGAKSDAVRTQNLVPLRGELGKVTGGVQGLQASIDRMHGKTVNVGVHASGSGGMTFTQKVAASISSGGFSLKSLAGGGIIRQGTGPTADDVPAMLSRGETVVSVADSAHPVMQSAFRAVGVPGYAGGGIAGMVPFAAGAEYDFGRAAESALLRAEFANLKKAVGAAAKATAVGSVGNYKPGAGVAQWRGVVSQALSLAGSSQQLVDAVLYQMQTESGGNPTIVNRTDSNWIAGHPSVGLMQVIRGTFAAYAGRYRGTGPFEYGVSVNPLANVYAAIKYAQANYGPGLRNAQGGIGSGHGYAEGGLVPGFASGGSVGKQGAAYLKAWQSRHGGGYGAAWGPKVLQEQIPEMAAAVQRAKALSGASGLSPGQRRFWANTAAGETKRLGVLGKELTTERAWRTQLGLNELVLDKEIRAAGNLKSLAGPVKGWKAQLGRDKARVAAISKMLGYSDAFIAAHPAPKPGPVLPTITHTYGGDVANNLGTVLAAALGPFTGAARGGMVFDQGGTLRPGFNPVWNKTGRPESLVPARGGGGVHLHLTVNGPVGSPQQLEDWFVRTANKTAQHGRLSQAVKAAGR